MLLKEARKPELYEEPSNSCCQKLSTWLVTSALKHADQDWQKGAVITQHLTGKVTGHCAGIQLSVSRSCKSGQSEKRDVESLHACVSRLCGSNKRMTDAVCDERLLLQKHDLAVGSASRSVHRALCSFVSSRLVGSKTPNFEN